MRIKKLLKSLSLHRRWRGRRKKIWRNYTAGPLLPLLCTLPGFKLQFYEKRRFHKMISTSKKYLPPSWVWSLGGVKTSLIPRPGPPRRVSLLTLTKMRHFGVGESVGSSVLNSHQSCCNCSRMTGSTPSSTKLCFTPSCRDNWKVF